MRIVFQHNAAMESAPPAAKAPVLAVVVAQRRQLMLP
jgi:hypothetical protein